MISSKAIAAALLDAEAFKISIDPLFTWTSGLKAPVYCDLRVLNSYVEARNLIVDGFVELAEGLEVDVVAGTATAGITWAAWVADRLQKPMVYVRKQTKGHGMDRYIEGHLPQGAKVLLIEDLISTAKSSGSAIRVLRHEAGVDLREVLAINTYKMNQADDVFDELGVRARALMSYQDVLEVALERGLVPADKLEMLQDFATDPAGWAARHKLG